MLEMEFLETFPKVAKPHEIKVKNKKNWGEPYIRVPPGPSVPVRARYDRSWGDENKFFQNMTCSI